jgi:hypothetical protein
MNRVKLNSNESLNKRMRPDQSALYVRTLAADAKC